MFYGELDLSQILDFAFTTRSFTTGAPSTLGGTPAISVYKSNSTTASTAGVTLSTDFNSKTGLNHVRIDTSADGTFYATANDFDLVITTGTVGGVSVVGEVVGHFSIRNRASLYPTTASRTLAVAAGGQAGVDWANVGSPTTTNNLSGTSIATSQVVASVTGAVGSVGAAGIGSAAFAAGAINRAALNADTGLQSVRSNTAQAGAGTTITLDASASATTDFYKGCLIYLTGATGAGQFRLCTGYVGSTKVATITPAWATNPDVTSTFAVLPAGMADLEAWEGVAPNALISGRVDSNAQATAANLSFNLTGNVTGNLSGSVGSVTGAVGSVTGAVGSVTGNVGGNVVGSVGSVTGAVGSVTGNVGGNVVGSVASVTGAVGSVTGNVGGNVNGNVVGSVASVTAAVSLSAGDSPVLQSGTASAGAASTITIQTALGADNLPVGCLIKITSGTGAKQTRVITGYVDATKVVTVDRAWVTNPDATSVYSILFCELPKLNSSLQILGLVLADTVTTYTGNTPQTGNCFTLIGATGSGLTSLAPSATALSTAQWTNTRATNLDNLDATVSTRSTYAGTDTAGTTTLLSRLTAGRATNLDFIDIAISSRLATASYTAPPTANANADALLDRTSGIETGYTPRQTMRLMLSAMAAKLSGAGTGTITIRDVNDVKARITATIDASHNRTAVTLDPT